MSIHNIPEIIKQKTGVDHFTLVYVLVLIGVGISAFGLGRLSGGGPGSDSSSGIVITHPGAEAEASSPTGSLGASALDSTGPTALSKSKTSGNYLASKNGKMYYTKDCKASSRIKEENKIWFDTASEAESLGYKRSVACK